MFNKAWLFGAAALIGSVGTADAAALTSLTGFTPGSTVNLGSPTSVTPTTATFALGGNSVGIASTNGIELENNATYGDSNFGANQSLVAECGYAGYGGCAVPGAMAIVFGQLVHSFTASFDDFDFGGPYVFTLAALDANGNTIGTLTANSFADEALASDVAYFAASSSVGIKTLYITDAPAAGYAGPADGDFVVGAIGVPEPSSVALLLAGLLGVAGLVRRRA